MTIEEGRHQSGLIAVDIGRFPAAHEMAEQGFGHFGIGVRSEGLAQHRRGDCHVKHVQPAIHSRKGVRQLAVGMAQCVLVETARNWHVAAERVPQQLLVKALNRRQNG